MSKILTYIIIFLCAGMAHMCAFMYESYVKCGSARKCRRKLLRKFPGNIEHNSNTRGRHELIKKVWSTGSLLEKKTLDNAACLPKNNYMGARLDHTTEITGTPCTRDRHL
jgi:hypothetical protein